VTFRYEGLDSITRQTTLQFTPPPERIDVNRSTWKITLAPDEQKSIYVITRFDVGENLTRSDVGDYLRAYRNTRRERRASTEGILKISTNNDVFDEILARATSDIYTLVTRTEFGVFPYAGIPWFSTVFGRDGIITAMFMLWVDPSIARGVLRLLANTQGQSHDASSDAQPGKILHELRHGEMANLGEVPFGRYYGSVDSTPLFIMLAGMYLQRTGDVALIREIWPNLRAALKWIDDCGDADRDGFVEYSRGRGSGLANQGWKDSFDAVFDENGKLAEGPIALCEVQGYVFAAKRHAAEIAAALGEQDLSARLLEQAERLRLQFEQLFWCNDLQTYAVALDGRKRPCRVRTSNAGHALFTQIASHGRARAVTSLLFSRAGFNSWGVRTLSSGEPRYNPMSYHNGSVWPHDNALIALGLSRYGFGREVSLLFSGMFDAARYQELRRLPELFCGFKRRRHLGPTPYPVACSPQAWAAGAFFAMISASLGLELRHATEEVVLRRPVLPPFLDEIDVQNLQLGTSCLNLHVRRDGSDVTVGIASRQGSAEVTVVK
jgi:glycogen debranching enzyme